ncbi:MAG: ECF transporter S component [Bacillota bacterium]
MNISTREIVIAGMLGAVSIILGATGLGLIPVPTPAGHATILHVPAILGGVLEGPIVGMLIGLIFGIFSFLRATNPIFADPIIAILPRLFIGIAAYYSYIRIVKYNQSLGLITAGVIGTAVNTIFVLGLAVIRGYLPGNAALAIAGMHGIPEAVVAAIIISIVGSALIKYRNRN